MTEMELSQLPVAWVVEIRWYLERRQTPDEDACCCTLDQRLIGPFDSLVSAEAATRHFENWEIRPIFRVKKPEGSK